MQARSLTCCDWSERERLPSCSTRQRNIKSADQWNEFLSRCSLNLRNDLEQRATPEEWGSLAKIEIRSRTESQEEVSPKSSTLPVVMDESWLAVNLNKALLSGDSSAFFGTLRDFATSLGVSGAVKEAWMTWERVHLSFNSRAKTDFEALLELLNASGLRFQPEADSSAAVDEVPSTTGKQFRNFADSLHQQQPSPLQGSLFGEAAKDNPEDRARLTAILDRMKESTNMEPLVQELIGQLRKLGILDAT